MFPNVRLMAASTLVSVMALFFAFGVYASLRVSHEPLVRSPRTAPLQLVGFNVAMLPVTVLAPFADQHAAQPVADNSSALAYSDRPSATPQPAPLVAAVPEARGDNTVDEPVENNDVTQLQITEAVDTARETKPAEPAPQDIAALIENMQKTTADTAPPVQAQVPAAPPVTLPEAPPAAPEVSPVEHTATIEATPTSTAERTATAEPAAVDDDDAVDSDITPKKKKKKHVARRHLYRAPVRTAAQSSAPQQPSSSIWPAGIGGPLVTAPKH